MINQLSRLVTPIRNKINSLIARSVINLIDDSGPIQKVQVRVLKNETLNAKRVFNSGFSSFPMKDDQAIIIFPNGNRENGYIVADIPAKRLLNLLEGDTAIYNLKNPEENNIKLQEKNQKITCENLEIKLKKLKIENDANELIDVLIKLIDEIIGARTTTGIGPQPLIGQSETFPAIKSKLESFKL